MPFLNSKPGQKRSPITTVPSPQAGESLGQRIESVIEDRRMPPAMVALFAISLAVYEWARWLGDFHPHPIVTTVIAVLLCAYAVLVFYRTRPELRNLRLALQGEKVVGEQLERLREIGYEVFHDIAAESFNLDHVIVGPAGIFTIETKTWSKPKDGGVLTCEGGELRFDGIACDFDRDPLTQARHQATWLRNLLKSSTAETFHVRPVILFPGWFIEPPSKPSDVWILNPQLLRISLEHAARVLSPSQISFVTHHLSKDVRHVRALRS